MQFLRHAFAEIGLVVVGILIAFQIDEWNTNRELRRKEGEYLNDIRISLQSDLESLQSVIDFNTDKLIRLQNMNELFSSNPTPQEVAAQANLDNSTLSSYDLFVPNRVAFDNMVAAENIDLISERALRNRLTEYYSQISPYEGTQERVAEISRKYSEVSLAVGMYDGFVKDALGQDIILPIRPVEEISPQTSIELLSMMFLLGAVTNSHSLEMGSIKQQVQALIETIDAAIMEP